MASTLDPFDVKLNEQIVVVRASFCYHMTSCTLIYLSWYPCIDSHFILL